MQGRQYAGPYQCRAITMQGKSYAGPSLCRAITMLGHSSRFLVSAQNVLERAQDHEAAAMQQLAAANANLDEHRILKAARTNARARELARAHTHVSGRRRRRAVTSSSEGSAASSSWLVSGI